MKKMFCVLALLCLFAMTTDTDAAHRSRGRGRIVQRFRDREPIIQRRAKSSCASCSAAPTAPLQAPKVK